MSAKDGGPAFPAIGREPFGSGDRAVHLPGMSLRDYFAGQFMDRAQILSEDHHGGWTYGAVAQCCYAMADAMLEARKALAPIPEQPAP